ncbi:MAG: S41 family peptidase [Draconibacterium sp.]
MKKTILPILFSILTINCLIAQPLIGPEELKSDIDFLISKYEKIHPNLYAYTDSATFKKKIRFLENGLTDSITSLDFWLKLTPIVNCLKDGHTSISPNYNDVGLYTETFKSKYKYLPFSVYIIDSVIYLEEIYGHQKKVIPSGSVIESINGYSSHNILKALIGYKSGERLEYRLKNVQKTFMWDYTMVFPATEYEIEYYDGNNIQKHVLFGISDEETNVYSSKAFPEIPDYIFRITENNIGYIEYNECQNLDKFKIFLDSSFSIIRQNNVEKLIIDIRRNGGGDSKLNDLLFTYLYNKPFHSYGKIEAVITDEIKKPFGYTQFKNDTIIELDTYENNKHTNNLFFLGKVYLLTSTFTFSSGADCAMLFKDYNVGTIIGQETGGLPTSYGDTYKFKLPNSGLNARVSWKFFLRPSGENDGRGVIPDIPIEYSINDLITGKDLEMDNVLKLINAE